MNVFDEIIIEILEIRKSRKLYVGLTPDVILLPPSKYDEIKHHARGTVLDLTHPALLYFMGAKIIPTNLVDKIQVLYGNKG